MSGATFSAKVIVVKKTKLGESDLILKLLSEDGSLLEAIAKGARKPSNASSGRLELFNCANALLAKGRSLNIVKESKLLWSSELLHQDPAYMASGACICEFASKTAQASLEQPRFFDLTKAALASLPKTGKGRLPIIVSAYLLKASAILGERPSFLVCASCGGDADDGGACRFAFEEGGRICPRCAEGTAAAPISRLLMISGHGLLHSKLKDIAGQTGRSAEAFDMLHLSHRWVQTHFNCKLKSASSLIAYCSM